MDWDVGPSPSQFSSSSQWARASNRPASPDNDEVGYVSWVPSQPDHPVLRKLMHMAESEKEKKREQKPRSDAQSTSTSTPVTHRTASLPVFATPSTSTLPSTSVSNSSRKLHPRIKPISKKVPPSRAYSATAPVKDNNVSPDPERAAGYLHIILNGTAKMDENSRLKQVAKAEAEKKAAGGTPGDIATRRNTYTSSSGSRFTSVTSTTRPLTKTSSFSSASSSAPPLRSALTRSLSSATIKPAVKLSRDNVTYEDTQMMVDSDRDTDPEGSTFTDSLDFAPDESFSMHVDDVVLPPKRAMGRTSNIAAVPSTSRPTASSSNSGFAPSSKALATTSTSTSTAFSEKIPQSRDVRPPVAPPTTQRGPPPLGMRRQHNLPNSGFPLSQSRYATTQSPYVASQAKGQKQVTLPPFKPPLLKKPNAKYVLATKQAVRTPESPPSSTPELDKDDSNDDGDVEDTGGAAGADSSFDVSFDVDADALEATMRQYD